MTDDKPTVRSLHDEAMRHGQTAYALRMRLRGLSRDEFDEMIAASHCAWELENAAIAVLMDAGYSEEERQPTERILRRSAVASLFSGLNAMQEWEDIAREEDA